MKITEFFELSIGRSQRSGDHLAFSDLEKVLSTVDIEALSAEEPTVLEIL